MNALMHIGPWGFLIMPLKRILLFVIALVIISGCVSSTEHKKSLDSIEGLKQDISSLEKKLNASEEKTAALEAELWRLKSDYEDISTNRDVVTDENATLKALLSEKDLRIKELSDTLESKNARILELKTEVGSLSQEKAKAIDEKERTLTKLKTTYSDLVSELNREVKKGEIEISQLRDKLSLRMVEKILFDSGSADIKKEGKEVLNKVAAILKKVSDKQIRVEGHTDNIPIGRRSVHKFPTNWELSTARATNVLRYLAENAGIDPKFLSSTGYAEFRPIASNNTPEGRAKNRRIEIVLVPIETDSGAAESTEAEGQQE